MSGLLLSNPACSPLNVFTFKSMPNVLALDEILSIASISYIMPPKVAPFNFKVSLTQLVACCKDSFKDKNSSE